LHFITLYSFYENDAWQELNVLSRNAASDHESSENQKPKNIISKLLFKDKTSFLSEWQHYLVNQQKQIVDSMLVYAKYINQQLITRLDLDLDLEHLCSKRFQHDIKCFNEDILQAIDRAGLNLDEFRARKVKARGRYFTGFNPAISNKAAKMIRQRMRSWKFHRWSDKSLHELATMCKPMLSGWINYYGRFYKSRLYEVLRHLDNILKRWAIKKYRKMKGSIVRASEWLRKIAQSNPRLFLHWHCVI
jgi:hypothetical protein